MLLHKSQLIETILFAFNNYFLECMIILRDVVMIQSASHIRAPDDYPSLNARASICCRQLKGAAMNSFVTKCAAVCSFPCSILCHVLLQAKLQHMFAGIRMSWEAQSMHVVVAKVSFIHCTSG